MKPVEIDEFYAIEVHHTDVLNAHSRQSLNDQQSDAAGTDYQDPKASQPRLDTVPP
jgi:hypothetical protein